MTKYYGRADIRNEVFVVTELLSTGWNEEPVKVHLTTFDRIRAELKLLELRNSHNPDQEEGASYFQLIESEIST